jgi:GR25 family glycosyltransferase involved in LPS biosynthesis
MWKRFVFFVWLTGLYFVVAELSELPVYWLNLDVMTQRRSGMEAHLKEYGVKYHKRVSALTPQTCNLIMVESHCNRVGFKDIAIVCSHVNALYTALQDNSSFAKNSKYFMVLEDDVRFSFRVNIEKLISSAPSDFGALQLMMSHKTTIEQLWTKHTSTSETFTYRPRNSTIWSAQAIIYNKDVIRNYIDSAVKLDRQGRPGFKLINSFDYQKAAAGPPNRYKPAIASECLFADMFMYSVAHPSYILNVPILNSAPHGANSSLHQAHVAYHVQGFAAIEQIQEELQKGKHKMPEFLSLIGDSSRSGGNNYWRDIAERNQVTASHGVPKKFNFKQQT